MLSCLRGNAVGEGIAMECNGIKQDFRLGRWARKCGRIWAAGIIAVVIAASMLAGCGEKKEVGPPDAAAVSAIFSGSFSALVDIAVALPADDTQSGSVAADQEVLSLQAQITQSEDCCLVEVLAPEHLEGLSFTVDSIETGNLTVSYKGISIQPDAMPAANLGSMVAGTLKALSQPEGMTITESAEGWCATGQMDAGGYALLLGKTDYMPIGLTIPDAGLSIAFTSFEAMNVFRPDRIEEDFAPQESSSDSSESSEPLDSPSDTSSEPSSAPEPKTESPAETDSAPAESSDSQSSDQPLDESEKTSI